MKWKTAKTPTLRDSLVPEAAWRNQKTTRLASPVMSSSLRRVIYIVVHIDANDLKIK
jgi:hypothetical protein